MNKNAFTLMELLGVITILGIIGLIITPVVTGIVKTNKEESYQRQLENIKGAAKSYIAANPLTIPNSCTEIERSPVSIITLGKLKDNGFIDQTVINPKTDENFNNETTEVTITYDCDISKYTYEISGVD